MEGEVSQRNRYDIVTNIGKIEELINDIKQKKLSLFTDETTDIKAAEEGAQYYNAMLSSLSKELEFEQGALKNLREI